MHLSGQSELTDTKCTVTDFVSECSLPVSILLVIMYVYVIKSVLNVRGRVTVMSVLFQGQTDILVGVKAEIGRPRPLVPDEGYLEFFVDW